MSATTWASSWGGIAGSDLEAEVAQPRAHDNDASEASAPHAHHYEPGPHTPLTRDGAPPADHAVELRGVGKRYGERTVLENFDLSIERGSFVAIVGRSGCGKSTLLRLIAELEATSAGVLEKRAEDGAPLDTRIMFQDARLLPWKTVLQNVMLGLGKGARDAARAVLAEVGLEARADDWPAQLSGGSDNALRWRVHWFIGRNCCCSTNRSARSMR